LRKCEVVAMNQPVDSERRLVICLVIPAGQRGRCRRFVLITDIPISGARSDPNKAFVRLQIGIHPPVARFEGDAQFVGDRTIDIEFLGIRTERRLPDDWIVLVCVLEQSLANPLGVSRRLHCELAFVLEEFRESLDDQSNPMKAAGLWAETDAGLDHEEARDQIDREMTERKRELFGQ
jgi:hypothetical protein